MFEVTKKSEKVTTPQARCGFLGGLLLYFFILILYVGSKSRDGGFLAFSEGDTKTRVLFLASIYPIGCLFSSL